MLLLASLMAKGGTISENGKGLLKELAVQKKPICATLVRAFEASQAGDDDTRFVTVVQAVIDGTMEELLKDLLFALPEGLLPPPGPSPEEPHLRVFVQLLRKTGAGSPGAKFAAVACPQIAVGARMSFDFRTGHRAPCEVT